MIAVRLMGGIGNQMFQYAAGRRLSHIHNAPLYLDLDWFEYCEPSVTPRTYQLGQFCIKENVFAREEEAAIKWVRRKEGGRLFRRLRRPPSLMLQYVKERHFHFDPVILDLPDNVYLEGHWQSEKYFADIKDILLSEFAFKIEAQGKNLVLSERIASSESVSVHIRRGDYISNPETRRIHHLCGPGHYSRSISMMNERVENPHYYVFSDEPEWVENNMALPPESTVVGHNGPGEALEDLRLMSLCRHHIMANSSFSWWGSWLGRHPNKVVIAPKKWFNKDNVTDDIYSKEWLRA